MTITPQYQAYLDGPVWKGKRLEILVRDKFLCQHCQVKRATQVHHKTYDRIFKERLSDLVSLCADCHAIEHGKKRKKKKHRRRKNNKKWATFGNVLAKVMWKSRGN